MLTDREREILHWIKQNPMISQQELADLAGITRSGVSAHLSNLTKKGYISGKGYVFPPNKYVTVIGGINIDIYGVSSEPIIDKSSNTGRVYYMLGGVGRNIAENLTNLDIITDFITVFGNDQNGETFKESALNHNINILFSKELQNERTSTYLYVNQPNGERVVGVDDMSINRYITPEFLKKRLPVINSSELMIIDSNLPKESIKWLYENVEVPIFAKAVSINKTPNLINKSLQLNLLVINAVEGSIITGIKVTDADSAYECVTKLIEMGIKNVCLYVDSFGLVMANAHQHQTARYSNGNVVNTNGAGAAIVSALAWAKLHGKSFEESLQLACKASEITSQHAEATTTEITKITE